MWVKICGIHTPAAARLMRKVRPDAVGFNFYPNSRRYVPPEQVRQLRREVGPDVTAVGVFVNATAEEIRRTAAQVQLDAVQLHGDEPWDVAVSLQPLPVIRAYRIQSEQDLDRIGVDVDRCRDAGCELKAVLLDSSARGTYGGTGEAFDWTLLERSTVVGGTDWPPLILAGGLRPDNVAAAIRTVHPWGVDTASGVEGQDGDKDPAKVEQFLRAARGQGL